MKITSNVKFILAVIILMMTLASCGSTGISDNSVNQESVLTENSSVDNSADAASEGSTLSESEGEAIETVKGVTSDEIKNDKIDYPVIEDIVWSVEELIDDGERTVLMSVKNNSNYPIRSFRLSFSEKKDITDEQKSTFFEELKNMTGATEEDIEDIKKSISKISMYAESDTLMPKDESVSNIDLHYFTGYIYMRSFDHFQLVEPDIAEIKYIDGELMKTVYYDFKSCKYNKDSKTETVKKWVDYDIADRLPKIDAICIDNEFYFKNSNVLSFDIQGMTLDNYKEYIEMCKEKGFTDSVVEADTDYIRYYYASDSEGYRLKLGYDEEDKEISISISQGESSDENDE